MNPENTAGYMIKELYDELARRANRKLQETDMTLSQMGLLMQLEQAPDGTLTVTELGKRLHIAQPTATGLVSRLEKKNYVSVLGDPKDRRVRRVRITQDGRNCCRQGEKYMRTTERELLHGLSEAENETFLQLLERVHEDFM